MLEWCLETSLKNTNFLKKISNDPCLQLFEIGDILIVLHVLNDVTITFPLSLAVYKSPIPIGNDITYGFKIVRIVITHKSFGLLSMLKMLVERYSYCF